MHASFSSLDQQNKCVEWEVFTNVKVVCRGRGSGGELHHHQKRLFWFRWALHNSVIPLDKDHTRERTATTASVSELVLVQFAGIWRSTDWCRGEVSTYLHTRQNQVRYKLKLIVLIQNWNVCGALMPFMKKNSIQEAEDQQWNIRSISWWILESKCFVFAYNWGWN